MKHRPATSRTIASTGYNPDTRVLEITFQHGKTYQYFDVEPETFSELVDAPSMGAYFARYIQKVYEWAPKAGKK